MVTYRLLLIAVASIFCASCATAPAPQAPVATPDVAAQDLGNLWVKYAAEYQAITRQVYQAAAAALPGFIGDSSWSALPEQNGSEELPAAVILDVDETVVSNVDFQMSFEPPFTNMKMYEWNEANVATPVAGVVEFVDTARQAGVTVFFVTNRPCERVNGDPDPCPQKRSTIEDIAEIGITTDAAHVFLSDEQGWNREKSTRRQHLARTHRIIMLFGDDLGDFLPCVRAKVYAPCTTAATAASRQRMVDEHREYWGHGWYVLPNPMHGSWTSAK
ncbi:MAG: hypothetical protein OEO82_01975 [Gammaproteobacteria bacterium]|nr:hypothetical protein [Gammaproteobacteria bacterium]